MSRRSWRRRCPHTPRNSHVAFEMPSQNWGWELSWSFSARLRWWIRFRRPSFPCCFWLSVIDRGNRRGGASVQIPARRGGHLLLHSLNAVLSLSWSSHCCGSFDRALVATLFLAAYFTVSGIFCIASSSASRLDAGQRYSESWCGRDGQYRACGSSSYSSASI